MTTEMGLSKDKGLNGSSWKREEPSQRMKQLELEFMGILVEHNEVEQEVVEI